MSHTAQSAGAAASQNTADLNGVATDGTSCCLKVIQLPKLSIVLLIDADNLMHNIILHTLILQRAPKHPLVSGDAE